MRDVLVKRRNSSSKTLSRFQSEWGGCQSVHGMSLIQIAFLSLRLVGYFTANAGGGGGGQMALPQAFKIRCRQDQVVKVTKLHLLC